ncbi:jg7694 [Pararge aegeria aegeria]|uniref:Jg7694 protein n=1 Tax=Pararge aegeria aegeria TaxID=348720 RepID=A0A8S4RYY7_9NEOP|nr:jg7694 [Pararge aegeria aegeria]
MAALFVQSRFAGLKIEDDDHNAIENQKSKKNKSNPPKKLDSAKKTKSSNNKPQPLSKKRKQKPVEATSEQWEMWKQKDGEIVDGNFETQMEETVPDEVITRLQFAETLEKKDKEISALKQQIISLKEELLTVKSRNKKLCNILGQGEMKDKAEILIEVERLRGMQSEMTAELASLHTDLEKERSKNADPRNKDKKKKAANAERDK